MHNSLCKSEFHFCGAVAVQLVILATSVPQGFLVMSHLHICGLITSSPSCMAVGGFKYRFTYTCLSKDWIARL